MKNDPERRIISSIFYMNGLVLGRLLSPSKSAYRREFPDHEVVFNANVILEKYGKVWYGDLDLTNDAEVLNEIAKTLDETIYVLTEMDGRFENENKPASELIKKAIWSSN